MKFIIVPIKPVGKARARVTRRGSYTPAKTAKTEKIIKEYAIAAGVEVLDGAVEMIIHCCFMPPKSWSQKKQARAWNTYRPLRPDADNIFKLCADALNGIAYHDDAQICSIQIIKQYDAIDRIIIGIKKL